MDMISKLAILLAATAIVVVAAAGIAPAGAQLVATSFGFPSIFQSGTTTAFTQDLMNAQNLQSVNINFGLGGFPSISQTSDQSYVASHTDYSHTEEVAAFNYPFATVGAAGLPGLGLPFGLC